MRPAGQASPPGELLTRSHQASEPQALVHKAQPPPASQCPLRYNKSFPGLQLRMERGPISSGPRAPRPVISRLSCRVTSRHQLPPKEKGKKFTKNPPCIFLVSIQHPSGGCAPRFVGEETRAPRNCARTPRAPRPPGTSPPPNSADHTDQGELCTERRPRRELEATSVVLTDGRLAFLHQVYLKKRCSSRLVHECHQ